MVGYGPNSRLYARMWLLVAVMHCLAYFLHLLPFSLLIMKTTWQASNLYPCFQDDRFPSKFRPRICNLSQIGHVARTQTAHSNEVQHSLEKFQILPIKRSKGSFPTTKGARQPSFSDDSQTHYFRPDGESKPSEPCFFKKFRGSLRL